MDKETNHTEPAEEMSFTEYEYVKLGSTIMMCSTHQVNMLWIDDKNAVCPMCASEVWECSVKESIEKIQAIKEGLQQSGLKIWEMIKMTTVIMLIIFVGLLKALDSVMTTAFEIIEDSWEVEEWLLASYVKDYYLRNWWATFGEGTTSATPKKTNKTDYSATKLKKPFSFSNLIDYKQIPKVLSTVIFDWLLDNFRLLGLSLDYFFFRLLSIILDYWASLIGAGQVTTVKKKWLLK